MPEIEIIPALMAEDGSELADYAREFRGLIKTVQIDVMDGHFVPERSWPYASEQASFERIIEQKEGLPLWQELNYEADLMIAHTETEIDKWVQSGVERVIVHYEALKDPKAFFARDLFTEPVNKEFMQMGVAINIDTPSEEIFSYIESGAVSFVQCMGIAQIGYQGQPFDERVLPKIEGLRKHYPELIISVDGGVGFDTIADLVHAGANRLVSGSAILESGNFREAIEELKSSAEQGRA